MYTYYPLILTLVSKQICVYLKNTSVHLSVTVTVNSIKNVTEFTFNKCCLRQQIKNNSSCRI